MAKFCTNCGKEIADGIAFCTECGTPAPADKPSFESETVIAAEAVEPRQETPSFATSQQPQSYQPQKEYQPPQNNQPQQAYQPPMPYQQADAQQEIKPKGGKYGVLSTGAFFGLILLFAIPVIGCIACIVMAFAPKNENLKHFARAMLIWVIIFMVLCVAMYFVFIWLSGPILDYINEITDGQFGNWNDILEQFKHGGFNGIPGTSWIPVK